MAHHHHHPTTGLQVERQHLVQSSINKLEENAKAGAGAGGGKGKGQGKGKGKSGAPGSGPPAIEPAAEPNYVKRDEGAAPNAAASASSSGVAGMSRADKILEGIEAD